MRAVVQAVAIMGGALLLWAAGAGATRTAGTPPLIGTNYAHYAISGCSQENTGIVASYMENSVRRRVKAQLAAMHAAGIETLRLLLWHQSDASGQRWGTVPSGGGRLSEPYRSNLTRYLRDVR